MAQDEALWGQEARAPFPIILQDIEVTAGITEPASAFVYYVNNLLRGGIAPENFPSAFLDLYALDYYESQVRNGGHAQFIGNSGALWQANLEHCLRGAERLGLGELTQVVRECRDWCEANPDERDKQDGWSYRPTALDSLDDRLLDLDYDDISYATFVARQPEKVQAWIRTATEATGFRARSQYHLAVGAWLLTQPGVQLLSGLEADASLKRLFKQHGRPC